MLLNLPQCAGQPLPQIITWPDLSIVPRLRNPKLNERLNIRGELKGLEIQANKKSILPNTQEGGREWDSSRLTLPVPFRAVPKPAQAQTPTVKVR